MDLKTRPLTVRQLQYVVAVAEHKSFRVAAQHCCVSQPALSAQVAELEQALGLRLFERDRRRVLVTAAGEAIVARARQLLVQVDDLLEAARRYADPLTGTLRLGVIPTIGPYVLPEIDPALRRRFGRLTLVWAEDKTASLVQGIARGELDGAILALEASLGELEYAVLAKDAFVLAVGHGHRLARGKGPVRMRDLEGEHVLLLDEGHCFRDQALALCAQAGVQEMGFRATSLATLAQMAAAGTGITLLPQISLDVENRRGQLALRRLDKPEPYRTLVLAWRRSSALKPSMQALAQAASEALEAAREQAVIKPLTGGKRA